MFKNPPKILAHESALTTGNFVVPDYIINKSQDKVNLFHRYCPHRMYPLAEPGSIVENIVCKFHGFEWTKDGEPVNNNRRISCGSAQVGKSGLVLKNFVEPDHQWVDDLATETNLEFSHVCTGTSSGSWLWAMDIQADLLHIRPGHDVVHPGLAAVTNLEDTDMYQGDGWALQTCSTGWWLCVYPYTFIEWSPGCLAILTCTPTTDSEFGFKWLTQFYYAPDVSATKREEFESLEDVFQEDVETIEKIKGKYFPLTTAHNRLEDHCIHFGKWVKENYSTNIANT
jgi:nitrite reductase/ring-hydroxylating ferredoxin subunit